MIITGYIVYKHTTPANKVYIGITSKSVNERWRNGNGYKHSPHFYAAIKKYGWDNIKHEVLFDNLTKEQAEQKEVELISTYNSTNREYGYNSDSGGNVNRYHNEETKQKIRNAHLGMKHTQETKDKISALKKGNKNRLGQHQSSECKKKLSKYFKGKFAGEKNYFHSHKFTGKNNKKSRAVNQYTIDGIFLKRWETTREFAKSQGLINATHITAVCKGKRKTAYGYIWKYAAGGESI